MPVLLVARGGSRLVTGLPERYELRYLDLKKEGAIADRAEGVAEIVESLRSFPFWLFAGPPGRQSLVRVTRSRGAVASHG